MIQASLIYFCPEIRRDISDLQNAWCAVHFTEHPFCNVHYVYRFSGFTEIIHFGSYIRFTLSADQNSAHSDSALYRASACVTYFHFCFLWYAPANRGRWFIKDSFFILYLLATYNPARFIISFAIDTFSSFTCSPGKERFGNSPL